VVRVPRGEHPPYGAAQGVFKQRVGKNCMPMDGQSFVRSQIASGRIDWSGQPARELTLADLDPVEIARAQRWGVSIQALARRAHELGIIAEHQYKYINIKIRELGWRKEEPGSANLAIEKPRILRKLVEMFYGNDFRRLAEEMRFPRPLVETIVGAHATAGELPKKDHDPSTSSSGSVVQFPRK
jgi:hypothetical protein